MGAETGFPIGSITKSFTATLVMLLVADGELELDAPVHRYLPELPELGVAVTTRQLLSHTSGLASGPDLAEVRAVSLRRYLADHCHPKNLLLPPGSGFSYSNLGYVVIAWLIETITGMTWVDAIESVLLRPLGIAPAFVGLSGLDNGVRSVAVGHSVNLASGRTTAVSQSMPLPEAATGSLAVSATDLVNLVMMHVEPNEITSTALLPTDHAAQMRRPVAGADPYGLADGWGLGFSVYRAGDVEWIGHDGNANGTDCHLRADPRTGTAVAFTSNANTGLGMWLDILDALNDAEPPISVPSGLVLAGDRGGVAQSVSAPDDCAGVYDNGIIEYSIKIDRHGDLYLYLPIVGDAGTRLTCYRDLSLSRLDPHSGRQVVIGRFLRDLVTHQIEAVQLGGRVAHRRRTGATG